MTVGVVLSTYGEPFRPSFTEQWAYSYRILHRLTQRVARIPRPVLPIIATSRAVGRVRAWKSADFVSDLEPLHHRTVAELSEELRARMGADAPPVVAAFEFRRPSLSDALRSLRSAGCDRAVIVPMYVAAGDFTHGMTRLAAEEALAADPHWSADRVSICGISDDEAAVQRCARMLAEFCLQQMRERGIETPAGDWAILLAAHGTVVTPIPGVDNGLRQCGEILGPLKKHLRPHVGLVRIGWLNHTRGGTWTHPAVPEALELIRARGYRNIIYYPWGFTTDNAETALEGRLFLEAMAPPFARVEHLPCLNTDGRLIGMLADRVCEEIGLSTDGGAARTRLCASGGST